MKESHGSRGISEYILFPLTFFVKGIEVIVGFFSKNR